MTGRAARAIAIGAIAATLWATSGAHAQEEEESDPGAEFLFGPVGTAIGYAAHRTSFVELGYTFGFMPWLSADGRQQVMASGLVYDENRGPVINVVMMIIALMGITETPDYAWESGGYRYEVYTAASYARAEQQRQDVIAFARTLPLSMSVRGYHSSLGSQIDGFLLDAGFRDAVGDGLVPVIVWGISGHVGYFATNPNWPGSSGAGAEGFAGVWGGGALDLRVTFFEYLGAWLHVAVTTDLDRVAVPIELGLEAMIGNRFVVRGLAAIDPVRPEALPDGIGMRLEAGVRL